MITILHGDARELLPIKADICITDPPYAVDKNGQMLGQIAPNYHEKGTHTRGYFDHDRTQYELLIKPVFDGVYRSLPSGGLFIAFCGNRTFHEAAYFAESVGFQMLDVLVFTGGGSFAKSKSMLMPRHELAMFMRKPGHPRQINPYRDVANLFHLPKSKRESPHPTTKPQTWMQRIVEVFTSPGEHILDPFMGSGSTLIAAQALGRSATGIELVSEYVDIARSRMYYE